MSYIHKTKCDLTCNCSPRSYFFLFFTNVILVKVVRPLKIYQHTKFYGPTLIGLSFVFTSEVRILTILEWLKLWD
jgi:hypothetical protein